MVLARSIIIWIGRHAFALVLIVAILVFVRYAVPPLQTWLTAQLETARSAPVQQQSYAAALQKLDRYMAEREAAAGAAAAALAQSSAERLRARRAQLGQLIASDERARLTKPQLALAALTGESDRIFSHYRAGVEITLHRRERSLIDALLQARSVNGGGADLQQLRRVEIERLQASHARWLAARQRALEINRRPLGEIRNDLCRAFPTRIGCENYRALVAAQGEMRAALAENKQARARLGMINRSMQTIARAQAGLERSRSIFDEQRSSLTGEVSRLEAAAGENWLLWAKQPVAAVLPTALAILALAILGPVLIKAGLYFLVAPIAARRPPIRLLASDQGAVREVAASAVSQQVRLSAGETMLLVPEAIQSTPHAAAKWTQWLLDYRIPVSSIASGMVGLTGLRASRDETVLVSATDGPLAEIALIEIPNGSAFVLRPRALRGMLLEPGKRPRITRHWKLGRLSAWLTLQFRYLLFHGPCTLVIVGTRGVRVEQARRGRGVNQAATIGFSAGLDYGVSRSETFGAYLMGKQRLFNDSFSGGAGSYLYEEMPLGPARGSIWGRGLRGIGDAALKMFGL